MNETTPANRVLAGLQGLGRNLIYFVRRALSVVFQFVSLDEIHRLTKYTERLGSAASESAYFMGDELRSVNERLASVEEELAALRRVVESESSSGVDQESSLEVVPPD